MLPDSTRRVDISFSESLDVALSTDEGQTWTRLTPVVDIDGPRAGITLKLKGPVSENVKTYHVPC